jgi:hypothetical protein
MPPFSTRFSPLMSLMPLRYFSPPDDVFAIFSLCHIFCFRYAIFFAMPPYAIRRHIFAIITFLLSPFRFSFSRRFSRHTPIIFFHFHYFHFAISDCRRSLAAARFRRRHSIAFRFRRFSFVFLH